ncbi:MAG: hypothetical protein KIT11_00500 [Fimbriimonadaceae bacterium]|nr:hypothetical protein [Fimbriimonadaceae bacterium]QYK55147.1 MAG: hypothetical protein KF733_09035 [Fimbriimonadaceae bacterium]
MAILMAGLSLATGAARAETPQDGRVPPPNLPPEVRVDAASGVLPWVPRVSRASWLELLSPRVVVMQVEAPLRTPQVEKMLRRVGRAYPGSPVIFVTKGDGALLPRALPGLEERIAGPSSGPMVSSAMGQNARPLPVARDNRFASAPRKRVLPPEPSPAAARHYPEFNVEIPEGSEGYLFATGVALLVLISLMRNPPLTSD